MIRDARRFTEEVKRHIVKEIESGSISQADAAREFCVAKSAVRQWLSEYGKFRPQRSVVEVVMKSEKERIAELEKALADAHLKIRVYDEILNQAGKKYKVDLKKTFGIPPSEPLEGTDGKSKSSAKR